MSKRHSLITIWACGVILFLMWFWITAPRFTSNGNSWIDWRYVLSVFDVTAAFVIVALCVLAAHQAGKDP